VLSVRGAIFQPARPHLFRSHLLCRLWPQRGRIV